MKELVMCKACGYIMEKGKVKETCPACGVLSKAFEPYVEKMSPKRKLILSLDIHPVMVHFSQAFIFSIMIMLLLSNFIGGVIRSKLLTTVEVLVFCLPFVVVATVLAGVFDGKVRFKRLTTQLLMKKIFYGTILVLLSAGLFVINIIYAIDDSSTVHLMLLVSIAAMLCATRLALIGVRLLDSKLPG
jgi:hypothetical protein